MKCAAVGALCAEWTNSILLCILNCCWDYQWMRNRRMSSNDRIAYSCSECISYLLLCQSEMEINKHKITSTKKQHEQQNSRLEITKKLFSFKTDPKLKSFISWRVKNSIIVSKHSFRKILHVSKSTRIKHINQVHFFSITKYFQLISSQIELRNPFIQLQKRCRLQHRLFFCCCMNSAFWLHIHSWINCYGNCLVLNIYTGRCK